MSRIGKLPVTVPAGVDVTIDGTTVTAKGAKGELTRTFPEIMTIKREGDDIIVERPNDSREAKAYHGLVRTLIANMVEGVSAGFSKKLQVGQVAANIRKWRKPEPYKGKGIRYEGEHVRRKVGKAGKD